MAVSRIIILGVAVGAAIGAGYFAKNMATPPPAAAPTAAAPAIQMAQVLVVANNVSMGDSLEGKLRWQDWPTSAVTAGFITKETKPEAVEELSKEIARVALYEGEPLQEAKLASGRTVLSTLLPAGKRAVATRIEADTSAGGFILPNDYVDVIMVRRNQSNQAGAPAFTTEAILKNIKVLAIDQTIEEDEKGQKTKVGSTATLELTPQQVEIISAAQQMADRLSLALRSVADIKEQITDQADYLVSGTGKGGNVRLIKSGQVTEVGTRK